MTKCRNMYTLLLLSNSGRHGGEVVEEKESSVREWTNCGKHLSWFVEASGVSCNKKPVSRGGLPSAPVPAGGPCLHSRESWHPPSQPAPIDSEENRPREAWALWKRADFWYCEVPPKHKNAKFPRLLLPLRVFWFVCFHEESCYRRELDGIPLIVHAHLRKLLKSLW